MIDTAIGIHYNGHNFIVKVTEKSIRVISLSEPGRVEAWWSMTREKDIRRQLP